MHILEILKSKKGINDERSGEVLHEILKDLLPFIISAITLILSNSNSRRKDDRDGLDDLNERLNKRNEALTRRVDRLTAENDRLRKELHDNDN